MVGLVEAFPRLGLFSWDFEGLAALCGFSEKGKSRHFAAYENEIMKDDGKKVLFEGFCCEIVDGRDCFEGCFHGEAAAGDFEMRCENCGSY